MVWRINTYSHLFTLNHEKTVIIHDECYGLTLSGLDSNAIDCVKDELVGSHEMIVIFESVTFKSSADPDARSVLIHTFNC